MYYIQCSTTFYIFINVKYNNNNKMCMPGLPAQGCYLRVTEDHSGVWYYGGR